MKSLPSKQVTEQEQRIEAIVKVWSHRLGFGQWQRLRIVYKNEIKEGDEDDPHTMTTAEVHADWSRMYGEIIFYLPCVFGLSDSELEHTVLHELAHIILSGLTLAAIAENSTLSSWLGEWTATRLAQIFVWIRDDLTGEKPK